MGSDPDGVEVVATNDEALRMASPPLLVVDALTEYLDEHGLGAGPLSWVRIGDGKSNITYLLTRGTDRFVLRRGPRPPVPASAHDMPREARIQRLVREAGIPVPEIFVVCEEESVLGVPFYVMEYVDGTVITDSTPRALRSRRGRRSVSIRTVDTLVDLHQVDVSSGELATLGRPDGYLRRQVDRFAHLWEVTTTRDLPLVSRIARWLAANRPDSGPAALVHGDFRTGNLMFARDESARVVAVLDWEMATVGDPLADLGYLTATYAEPASRPTLMELTPVTREPGYLDRAGLVERYRERTGADLDALPWYQALALWKAAVFCEAIHTRWLRGERPDDTDFGPLLADGIPALLDAAAGFAGLQRGDAKR